MAETASFGQLLRSYRIAAGLSQEALAERAGLSAQAISALERGLRRIPYLSTVRLLARALELQEQELQEFKAAATRRRGPVTRRPVAATPSITPAGNAHALPALSTLPLPLTPLVGRVHDEAAVIDLLQRDGVRLLTLTGPGGVGKTRLAVQVATRLHYRYAGGVVFVSLAALREPDLLIATIAQALEVREAGNQPLVERLIAHLHTMQMLLVLDNFEHVVAAAPVMLELLTKCPRLTILVTSRSALRVRGEQEYDVPSLAVPDPANLPAVDDVMHYAAVALFVQRVQAIKPDFMLSAVNAATVAAICRQLDGLPLALELAAARIKLLPPAALLARLDQGRPRPAGAGYTGRSQHERRLDLLAGGRRDLPARQQTLRDTIAWSYDLLDEAEKTLLQRLSVFVGGFTLEAAEAVCNADGVLSVDMLEGLASLMDKSLLQSVETRNGDVRFAMLETIREYGLERLEVSGQAPLIRTLHRDWFLALAEQENAASSEAAQRAWLDSLDVEHDNLRAALEWSVSEGGTGVGLRLAAALSAFWGIRGHLTEGRQWLELLLSASSAAPPPEQARARIKAGNLAWTQGDLARAATLYEESRSLYQEMGDRQGLASALFGLGLVALTQDRYDQAALLFENCLTIYRELKDRERVAIALLNLGEVARCRGDYANAVTLLEESLCLCRELGDKSGMAAVLLTLGEVARCQGDYGRARASLVQSLALWREFGHKRGIALTIGSLAYLAHGQGDSRNAIQLLAAATLLRESIGVQLSPPDRRTDDRIMEELRATLGGEAFADAWLEGQAMTLHEAITRATGEAELAQSGGTTT